MHWNARAHIIIRMRDYLCESVVAYWCVSAICQTPRMYAIPFSLLIFTVRSFVTTTTKLINDATIQLCHTSCPLYVLQLSNELFLACMKFIIGPSFFARCLCFLASFGWIRSQSIWRVQCFRGSRLKGGCGKGQKRSSCNYKNVRFDIMWMTRKQLTVMLCRAYILLHLSLPFITTRQNAGK